MKALAAQAVAGILLAVGAIVFGIGCFLQWMASSVGGGRGKTDPTFYWNWVWAFTGIFTGIVACVFFGVWLLIRATDEADTK